MPKILKAETFISLSIAILLTSILLLNYEKWQNQHNKDQQVLYQRLQAMQISENQLALKARGLPCETVLYQNKITFKISCFPTKINVEYPTGEFQLVTSQ